MAGSRSISTVKLAIVFLAIWSAPSCSANVVGIEASTANVVGIEASNFLGLPWGIPCLQAVIGTEGCVQELVTSFLSLQPSILGPNCCRAAISVDDNCWPKIFPLNPFFPPLLKSFCRAQLHLPPSAA